MIICATIELAGIYRVPFEQNREIPVRSLEFVKILSERLKKMAKWSEIAENLRNFGVSESAIHNLYRCGFLDVLPITDEDIEVLASAPEIRRDAVAPTPVQRGIYRLALESCQIEMNLGSLTLPRVHVDNIVVRNFLTNTPAALALMQTRNPRAYERFCRDVRAYYEAGTSSIIEHIVPLTEKRTTAILEALASYLNPRELRIVKLRYFEGKDTGEIATALRVTKGCVSERLPYILATLYRARCPVDYVFDVDPYYACLVSGLDFLDDIAGGAAAETGDTSTGGGVAADSDKEG